MPGASGQTKKSVSCAIPPATKTWSKPSGRTSYRFAQFREDQTCEGLDDQTYERLYVIRSSITL